jgi:hypothetical protein
MNNLVNFKDIPNEFTINVRFEQRSLITLATVVAVIAVVVLLAQKAIKNI